LKILAKPFRALVIGSSGAIGSTFVELLKNDPSCVEVAGIHRKSMPVIDYFDLETIEASAEALSQHAPYQLIINAIGVLHSDRWMPEKRLDDLNPDQFLSLMQTNAIGPVLTIRHFVKLLDPAGSVMVTLSAKVGSIEDNRLGGWYSYRSSKAALNMLIKTAAIELARTKPNIALIALHPGTVNSRLSKPFRGQQIGRPALNACTDMLNVIKSIEVKDSGSFVAYSGERLPW
jgi:NAD(P)-dependent dehydrogenase (short-subunit alcohol dehydrogenase family)